MTQEEKEHKKRVRRTLIGRFARNVRERFDLLEDSASQEEVEASVYKSVEFKGTNLWVLICATFIASLGLNVNSTAVIIGAMLISPLMGPIIGVGMSLGINDFQLLKKSLRNFMWMFAVSIITSSIFFVISPYSNVQSELLARTSPTTYDVLIAFFGGIAGMLAQTRRDRTGTVIAGVAIATAIMPPLCTAGFGIANGEVRFILGALYLFMINAVFIALASYIMVLFLKYEKKTILDEAKSKRMNQYMMLLALIIIVPSLVMTVGIIRRTQFETNVDKYIDNVFRFNATMVVDYEKYYHYDGKKSSIEVNLVGEPLSRNMIENATAQMVFYGLENTELVVRQADNNNNRIDFSTIQRSFEEIVNEKNKTIEKLETRLATVQTVDTIAVSDLAREIPLIDANVGAVAVSKHISYTTNGQPSDTTIVVSVTGKSKDVVIDNSKIRDWLRIRLKTDKIEVIERQ